MGADDVTITDAGFVKVGGGGWRKQRRWRHGRGTGAVILIYATPFFKNEINNEAGKPFADFIV